MKFKEERIISTIPKGKFWEIVVRNEINPWEETVTDIRLRNKVDGAWMFTRHGITYPAKLNVDLIDALTLAIPEPVC